MPKDILPDQKTIKDRLQSRTPLTTEVEMNDRLFAHIHLDARLIGSHLQGANFKKTNEYLLKVISHLEQDTKNLEEQKAQEEQKKLEAQKAEEEQKAQVEQRAQEEQKAHQERKAQTEIAQAERAQTEKAKELQSFQTALNKIKDSFKDMVDIEDKVNALIKNLLLRSDTADIIQIYEGLSARASPSGSRIDGLHDIAKSIVDTLDKKGEVLIPGGWNGQSKTSPGHVMAYKFIKESDGSYTFLLFNTGAGLEFHLKHPKFQNQYCPIMAFKIEAQEIQNLTPFIMKLLEPQVAPPLTQSVKGKFTKVKFREEHLYDEEKLYRKVISKVAHLGGKKIDPKPYFKQHIKGQFSGTCAMRVPMLLMYNALPKDYFPYVLYQARRLSVMDYYQHKKKQLNERTTQRLLNKANRKLLKTTRKFLKKKIGSQPLLSQEDIKETIETCAIIQQDLKAHAPTRVLKEPKKLPNPNDYVKDNVFEIPEQELNIAHKLKKEKIKIEVLYQSFPKPMDDKLQYIEAAYKAMINNDLTGQSESLIKDFEDFILSIPLDFKKANEYWDNLQSQQCQKIIDQLQTMFRIYGKHCYLKSGYPFARRSITSQSVHLIATLLGFKYFGINPNPDLNPDLQETKSQYEFSINQYIFSMKGGPKKPLSTLLLNLVQSFNTLTDPTNVTGDPKWDERVLELQTIKKLFGETFYDGHSNDHWDTAILDRHKLQNEEWITQANLNDRYMPLPKNRMEGARLALYAIAKNEQRITVGRVAKKYFDPAIRDFNFRLQLQEFIQECSLFPDGGFDYFFRYFKNWDPTLDRETRMQQESRKRLSNIEVRIHEDENTNYNFQTSVENVIANKSYEQTLSNALSLQHTIAEKTIFPDESVKGYIVDERNYAENSALIYFEKIAKSLSEDETSSYPIFSLPFTRAAVDEPRVIATKDFFEANLDRLEEHDFQIVFWLNFCTPLLLNKQLSNIPEFANSLVKMLEEGFKLHQQGAELGKGAVFCLRLSYFLQKYIAYALNKDKLKPILSRLNQMDDKIINAIRFYQKEIATVDESIKKDKLKSRLKDLYDIYTLRLSLKEEQHFKQPKESLLQMLPILLERHWVGGENSENRDVILEDELEHGLIEFSHIIKKLFFNIDQKEREELISTIIMNNIFPKISEPNQVLTMLSIEFKEFPIVFFEYLNQSNHKEIIQIDFSLGLVRTSDVIYRSIPTEFYSADIIQTFGNQNLFGKVFYSQDARMAEFEIEETADKKLEVDISSKKSPEITEITWKETKGGKEAKETPKTKSQYRIIIDNKNNTHLQKWFTSQNAWFERIPQNTFNLGEDLPLHFTEQDRQWWVDCENAPPKSYFSTDLNGNLLLQIKARPDSPSEFEILELETNGRETGYRLEKITVPPKFYSQLLKFEDEKFIECWFNKDPLSDIPLKISLKRYGLEFECIKDKDNFKLVWKENRDFVLALKDYQSILDFPHILYLENEKTKEKLCFLPHQSVYVKNPSDAEEQKRLKESFETQGEYYKLSLDISNDVPKKILSMHGGYWNYSNQSRYYRIPMKEDGTLLPKTPAQCLYLAFLHLSKYEPEQAMDALRKCNELGGLEGTLDEVSLIQKIMLDIPAKNYEPALYTLARTNDPETQSVRLYAAWLLAEFKQVHLDKPQFNLTMHDKQTFKDKSEQLKYNHDNQVINFYKNSFNREAEIIYQDYQRMKGNIAEDMQLTPDHELSLLRTIFKDKPMVKARLRSLTLEPQKKPEAKELKDIKEGKDSKDSKEAKESKESKDHKEMKEVKDTGEQKAIWERAEQDNETTIRRWRELELIQLRKEEHLLVKKHAQLNAFLKKYQEESEKQTVDEKPSSTSLSLQEGPSPGDSKGVVELSAIPSKELKKRRDSLTQKRKLRRIEILKQLPKKIEVIEKRLQKVRSILKSGKPYYLTEYELINTEFVVSPNFDEQLSETVLSNLNNPHNSTFKQTPKELSLMTSFENIVMSFENLYNLAQTKKEGEEKTLLKNYLKAVLQEYFINAIPAHTRNTRFYNIAVNDNVTALCVGLLYVLENPKMSWTPFPYFNLNEATLKKFFNSLQANCIMLSKTKPISMTVPIASPHFQGEVVFDKKETILSKPLNLSLGSIESTSQYDLASKVLDPSFIKAYRQLSIDPPKPKDIPELINLKSFTEPFFQKEAQYFMADLRQGIQNNQETRERNKLSISYLKNQEVLFELSQKLRDEQNAIEDKLKQDLLEHLKLKQEKTLEQPFSNEEILLQLANRKLTGRQTLIQTQLMIGSHERLPLLKFNDLLHLYLKNDTQLFKEKTLLKEDEIQELYQLIHRYLLDQTAIKQINRVDNLINTVYGLNEPKPDTPEDPDLNPKIHELARELFAKRSYAEETHPEWLAFEYIEDILLKPNQVATLEHFLEEGPEGYANHVAQLIMGAGKSKILLPLLALKKANGTNLSIIEVSQSLYETNLADLRATTQRFFGKQAHRFLFSRDSPCSSKNINALVKKLKQVMTEQEFIVTTAESVQALELKYWELLITAPKKTTEYSKKEEIETRQEWERQIKAFEKLIKIFKEQGDALLDEVDSNLDPKKELNYTIGQPIPIKEEYLKTILEVFNLFEFVPVQIGTTHTTLDKIVTGEFVIPPGEKWDHALIALVQTLINHPESPIFSFLNSLERPQKKELEEYLLQAIRIQSEDKALMINPLKPEWLVELKDEKMRKTIDLLKGELQFLKYTLLKKANEHYGFQSTEPQAQMEHAIPYLGNNIPNKKAQFGSVYETINYTLQLQYKQKGIALSIVKEFITDFHRRANQQLSDMLGAVTFEQTQAYNEFLSLTGLSLNKIHPKDAVAIIDLQKEWSEKTHPKHKVIKNYCLLKYSLNKIKHYPRILRNNAINHASIYRSRQGFTGTPANYRTFHPDMVFDPESGFGIDGETYDHIKNAKVSVVEEKDPKRIIENAMKNHKEANRIHAFIDVGALFKLENLEIAKHFAKYFIEQNRSQIKHILYFNKNDVLCALPIESIKKIQALREKGALKEASKYEKMLQPIIIGSTHKEAIFKATGSKPEQCFTYYDQVHTLGIDIPQPLHSIGLLTVDFDTDARSFAQGAKRLRDLGNTQKIEILTSKDMELSCLASQTKEAKETEDKGIVEARISKPITIKDVTHQLITNQWTKLAEYHFQAALQKMSNLVREDFGKKIQNKNRIDEKEKLFNEFYDSFIMTLEDDPTIQFGSVETWQETSDLLNYLAGTCFNQWKEKCDRLKIPLSDNEYANMRSTLEKISKETAEVCLKYQKHIPKNEDMIVQIQVQQAEKEQEKEKNKRKELDQSISSSEQTDLPRTHNPWNTIPLIKADPTNELSTSFPPFIELNRLLSKSTPPPSFAFNENLFVSNNYAYTTSNTKEGFNKKKPLNFLLFVESPKRKPTLNAMLLTQKDAKELSELLNKERKSLEEGIKIEIMSTHDTLLNRTFIPIIHRDMAILKEQACFFNGDLDQLSRHLGNVDWILKDKDKKLDYLQSTVSDTYPEKLSLVRGFARSIESVTIFKNMNDAIINQDLKSLREALTALFKIDDPYLKKNILNATNRDGYHLLNLTILQGKLELVHELMQHEEFRLMKYKIDAKDRSPFMLSLQSQNEEMINLFSDKTNLDTDYDEKTLSTLFLLSSQVKDPKWFHIFYEKLGTLPKTDFQKILQSNLFVFSEKPILLDIIQFGSKEALKALLENPDIIWRPKSETWEDPIHVAIKRGDQEVLDLFLNDRFLPSSLPSPSSQVRSENEAKWFQLIERAIRAKNATTLETILKILKSHFSTDEIFKFLEDNYKNIIVANDRRALQVYFDYIKSLDPRQAYYKGFKIKYLKLELKNTKTDIGEIPVITGPLSLALEEGSVEILKLLLENLDTTLFNPDNFDGGYGYPDSTDIIKYGKAFIMKAILLPNPEGLKLFLEKLQKVLSDGFERKALSEEENIGSIFQHYSPTTISNLFFRLIQTQEFVKPPNEKLLNDYAKILDLLMATPGFIPSKEDFKRLREFWWQGVYTISTNEFTKNQWYQFKEIVEKLNTSEQQELLQPSAYEFRFTTFLSSCPEDILLYLLPKIKDVNMKIGDSTLLHNEFQFDNIERFKLLLQDQRFDINLPDASGNTPFMAIVRRFNFRSYINIDQMDRWIRTIIEDPRFDPRTKPPSMLSLPEILENTKFSVSEDDKDKFEKLKSEWINIIKDKIDKLKPESSPTV